MTIDTSAVSAESSAQNAAVLNESMVGAGTTLRFVLLLLLFTVGGFSMFSYVVANLSGSPGKETGCALAAGIDPGASAWAAAARLASEPANSAAYDNCISRYAPDAVWLPLAATAVLIMAAFGLYWLLPEIKRHRSGLIWLDEVDVDGRVQSVLDRLVATAGLADRAPGVLSFMVNPSAVMTTSAVAFGRRRRYTVCLDLGLLADAESEWFRVVVLHELAHIANRDVDVTYVTVALWRVFLIAALCPDAAVTAYALARHDRWALSWGYSISDSYGLVSLALLVLLSYLARADILRTREIYADRTSVRWGADREAWSGRSDLPGRRDGAVRSRLRALSAPAKGLWRLHPAWDLRRRSLEDPQALFALSALPMFLAGVASDLAASELNGLLNASPISDQVHALFGAVLATAIAGVAMWRAVVYAVLTGRPVPSGLGAGLWLGAGVAISEFVYTEVGDGQWLPAHPEAYLMLIAAAMLVLTWTAQTAELFVRTWRGKSLRPVMAIGLSGSCLVFTYLMYWWYATGGYLISGWPISNRGVLQSLGLAGQPLAHPDVLLSATAVLVSLPYGTSFSELWWIPSVLWLVPLLAWTMGRTVHRPVWHVRALSDPGCSLPEWDLPRLRRICCIGLLGGALACGGVAAVMTFMNGIARSGRYTSGLVGVVYPIAAALAICGAMALTAVITVFLVKRYRLVMVLIAVGTTAFVGLVGQYALLSTDGCLGPFNFLVTACRWHRPMARLTTPWNFVADTACTVLQLGFIVAGLVALGAVAWDGMLRTNGQVAEEFFRHTLSAQKTATRRITIVAACVLTVGFIAVATAQTGLGLSGGSSASAIPASYFGGPAVSSSSASLGTLQVAFWITDGGGELALDIGHRITKVVYVFTHKIITPRQLTAPCSALADTVPHAQAYFTVPSARGEQLWSQFINDARSVDATCRTYLKVPTKVNLNGLDNAASSNAINALLTFFKWFDKQQRP